MNLPKKHFKSTNGQILILFLLVLVLGMAIVLSVASRTVTDIKITTTSDESNRAYFAAEAGVEEALKRAETTTSDITLRLDFPDINTTATTQLVDVAVGARGTYIYPFLVGRDDVAQINMLRTYPNLGTGWCPVGPFAPEDCKLLISWGTDPAGANGQDQAIEVSVLYNHNPSALNFLLTKFGFDPNSANHPQNNFCGTATGVHSVPAAERDKTDPRSGITRTVFYQTTLNIRTGVVGAGINECHNSKKGIRISSGHPVFLRIRPLYNVEPIPIVVESDPPLIPNQGDIIESVGKTDSGVTRKIEVTTTYPAMPSIFDYVLFNGGPNALTKN